MKRVLSIGFFILGASLLMSLCVWQVYRAQWKDGVIEKLDIEYAKDPFERKLEHVDFAVGEIHSGYIQGRFVSDMPLFWPKTKDGSLGFYVMYLFAMEEGFTVLVNVGWVYEDSRTHMPLETLEVSGTELIKIGGIARAYDAGRWSLTNNPEKNRWYKYDTKQLSDYVATENELLEAVLFAKQVWPEGSVQLGDVYGAEIYPRDTHYQYALFWFIMFAIWVAMMGCVIVKRR